MVYAPGVGTGFVSVGDYLDANRGTLAREQGQISDQLNSQVDAARNSAQGAVNAYAQNPGADYTQTPGYENARRMLSGAQEQATALGSQGGLSDYFRGHFGDTKSQGDFDASLLGYHPPQFGDLSSYLDRGMQNAATGQANSGAATHNRHGPTQTPPETPPTPEDPNSRAIDPNHTDPNGGPSYWNPWDNGGGG